MSISVGAIIKNDNHIALVQQTYRWFPKHHLRDTETDEQCIARVLYDECGIVEYKIEKYIGSYLRKWPITGEDKEIKIYLCTSVQEKLQAHIVDIKQVKRVSTNEILQYLELTEDQDFIQTKLTEIFINKQ